MIKIPEIAYPAVGGNPIKNYAQAREIAATINSQNLTDLQRWAIASMRCTEGTDLIPLVAVAGDWAFPYPSTEI